MTRSVTLTKTVEKQITEDWQRQIPSLGIYQLRHLLRRVGPLLVGICLERDSGAKKYKPMFHVHCLGMEAPAVYLTLFTQLRSERSGGPDFVQVQWHEEKYREAAARMVRQSLLPLAGDLLLDQVINAYEAYLASPLGRAYPVSLYRDMIMLLAWGGHQAKATKVLADCLKIGDEGDFQNVGGRTAFETECRKRIERPVLIQQTVDSQIVSLGVGELPLSQLTQ